MAHSKGVHFSHDDEEIVINNGNTTTPELSPSASPSVSEASLPSSDGTLVYHQAGLSTSMLDAQKKPWDVYEEREESNTDNECATGDEYVDGVLVRIANCKYLSNPIPISAGKNGRLTVGRFYSAIYEHLHQSITTELSRLAPEDEVKITAASKARCVKQGKATHDGVRRVDYLLGRHVLKHVFAVPGESSWSLEFTTPSPDNTPPGRRSA
ncbi:unnamed protein product [Cyclocybe aegerita]|uniref:DUF6699 domain-containing protein n=1 Tax=Cyclocybe aegerita TaxID=1973307 RepID=A0A8S0W3T0_CYCAE|nr:unnamed protein product [Cyclocybe aegerita]